MIHDISKISFPVSITEIARMEGVSRQAIRARIQALTSERLMTRPRYVGSWLMALNRDQFAKVTDPERWGKNGKK